MLLSFLTEFDLKKSDSVIFFIENFLKSIDNGEEWVYNRSTVG